MRQTLTGDDIFAEVLLRRAYPNAKSILIVEDDADSDALGAHIDDMLWETLSGQGKSNVLQAMRAVAVKRTQGVAGLVDRDIDQLVGTAPYPKSTYRTGWYDLEAEILLTPGVASRLAFSQCGANGVRAFLAAAGAADISEVLVALAFPIGLARLLSRREDLRLSLRDFPIGNVLDGTNHSVDLLKLANLSVARSPGARISAPTLHARLIGGVATYAGDRRLICSGHDMLSALVAVAVADPRLKRTAGLRAIHAALRGLLDCPGVKNSWFYARSNAAHPTLWTC